MHSELFRPTIEGEARLLLLIDAFTSPTANLESRTKLAKLDFLLRYPGYFQRAFLIRRPNLDVTPLASEADTIEQRMVRFRYGPWDPAYFTLIGSLIGRGFVIPVSGLSRGVGYRVTPLGADVSNDLRDSDAWRVVGERAQLLKKHFDLTGTSLKNFIYEHFPEVGRAAFGERL